MKYLLPPLVLVLLLVTAGGAWLLGRTAPVKEHKAQIYYCPMHPQYRSNEPGKCPYCTMDLVVFDAKTQGHDPVLELSEAEKKLAEIATAAVERRFVETTVRMVGMVDYDETRVRTISAWVPGRLERLFVDFTGTRVRKGDHLVSLYSPELLTAQEELLEQKREVEHPRKDDSEFLRESSKRALESARDKLRLWGLSNEQIAEIEKRGTAEDHVVIPSPTQGIVIHKALNQGAYVKVGTPIYRIAELDQLWVQLDAYESDLSWIRYGQDVEIETEAVPGKKFHGWISFLAPELDRKTRTVKVRVNVENPNEELKPGMFVRAVVHSKIAAGGRVMDPKLAGKWICPMHPEVLEDGPGQCRICQMQLVPAEKLGYVSPDTSDAKPLVVPRTAVLWTGKRSIVYVEKPGTSAPTYEGRVVVLGPRANDYYLVKEGLSEGEQVVVHGNFKIDSALQIMARPSMMSMKAAPVEATRDQRLALAPVLLSYLDIQAALAGDSLESAKAALGKLADELAKVDAKLFDARWKERANELAAAARSGASAKEIQEARRAFSVCSRILLDWTGSFGHANDSKLFEVFCPMAFDSTGASWLQVGKDVHNPYFGAEMLDCGTIKREFQR